MGDMEVDSSHYFRDTLSAIPKVVCPYLGPSQLAESGFKEGEAEEETAPKVPSDT